MKIGAIMFFINEAPWLREWVEFHSLVGIDTMYLFDNASNDCPRAILGQYPCVKYEYLPEPYSDYGKILGAKRDAVVRLSETSDCDWLAILDSDEFLYPTDARSLHEVFSEFPEDVGQVGVNWKVFGHGYKRLLPGQLLTEHLTLKRGDTLEDRHIKPVVRPRAVKSFTHSHYADLREGYRYVDSVGRKQEGAFVDPPVFGKLAINHYIVRDLTFAETEKARRYSIMGVFDGGGIDPNGNRSHLDRANDIEDLTIQRFLPQLKERL